MPPIHTHTQWEEALLPVSLTNPTVSRRTLHHDNCWNTFTEHSCISGVGAAAPESDKPLRFWFFPLPGHVRTRGDPQIAIWRSNASELSRPREAPSQEDAAALRPAEGRASPLRPPKTSKTPHSLQKAALPSATARSECRQAPDHRRASQKTPPCPGVGGETQATPSTDPRLTHSPHRRGLPAGPQPPPPRRAGQGRAGPGSVPQPLATP